MGRAISLLEQTDRQSRQIQCADLVVKCDAKTSPHGKTQYRQNHRWRVGLWTEEKEKSRPGLSPDHDRAVGGDNNRNPSYFLSLWMSMTSPASFTSIVT